jgi:hypothetical protein
MSSLPDLSLFDLKHDGIPAVKVELPSSRRRRDRQFLPALPERVFCRLLQLPGRSWAVYLVLMLRSRLERKRTVVLTSCFLTRFGLTRDDKSRALCHLERAGLVRVERRDRKNPAVTILGGTE